MASKRGNRHALRHGLYAREAVLPWENPEVFAALHQSFVEELNPVGALEEEAVREVAELHWRKQRLAMGYLLPFYRDMPSTELTKAASQGLIPLATYLAGMPQSSGTIFATSAEVLDLIKGRLGGGERVASQPGTAGIDPSSPVDSPHNIVECAYDPAALELRLKIETAIDNRIAKIMTRLVGVKEYKRLYGAKGVVGLPTASSLAPPAQPSEPVSVNAPAQPAPIKKRNWGDPE
jgi:hypothetical protein